ncbi:13423_t:CDS:2 [Ambispora leptoticha]|uniref:13423_t:CDS:1 n=1 Tax=Ambispora leptoticha TaxID=144679 RepID=A0A9N9FAU6_9GLOM|nr:13423_t:CDS:2 [Ambispora leptoticha]
MRVRRPVHGRAVPIVNLLRNEDLPPYKKRICCGKPELSVLVAGTIEGLRHEELESWLQEATPLRFEHIWKKQANGWGHVHFSTHYDASRFFNEMKDKTFTGPYDHIIRFSGATYFKSKKTVDYIIGSKTHPLSPPSTVFPSDTSSASLSLQTDKDKSKPVKQSSLNKSQYALYDNNEGLVLVNILYHLILLQIDIADDDQTITITAENLVIEENGTEIVNNLSTRFEVNIDLPRMVHADHPVNVNIEHGIITVSGYSNLDLVQLISFPFDY